MSISAITGTAGAAIGNLAGGTFGWTAGTWTQLGWTAGVMLGTYLFQPETEISSEGPRLDDLKVTTSTYGNNIPTVFGSYRIAGNIIFALPLVETRHEERQEEGKGGGGTTTSSVWYTYAGTFAVALCRGPIDSISRIWFGSTLVYDNGVYSGGLNASNTTVYLGTDSQDVDWRIQAKYPDTPAYRHVAYVMFSDIELEDYGKVLPNVSCEVVTSNNTVEKACIEITEMSGLTSQNFDYTQGTDTVQGYVLSKSMTARAAIAPLLSAYEYALVETNHKLLLRKQKQTPIKVIGEEELGANSDTDIEYNLKQEIDCLKSISIRYANADSDYQTSVQQVRRIDTKANEESNVELSLALTDNQAKQLCEKMLYQSWRMRQTFRFNLNSEHNDLIAGDVITINYDSAQTDVRITEVSSARGNLIQLSAVANDITTYTSNAVAQPTDENGVALRTSLLTEGAITSIVSSTIVTDSVIVKPDDYYNQLVMEFTSGENNGHSVNIVLYTQSGGTFEVDSSELPYSISVDDTYRIYNSSLVTILDTHTLYNLLINDEVLYCGATAVNEDWKGCEVYSKTTQEDNISPVVTLLGNTIQGTVLNTLQEGTTYVWDRINTVTVKLDYGTLLEATEADLVTNGSNYCIIGDEILQYATVTDNLNGTYTLSNLLRGRRGTESYTNTHVINEKFMLLNDNTMAYMRKAVGSSDFYSSVSLGLPLEAATESVQVTNTGKSLKPFSPQYFRFYRDGNNIHLSWMRRSRYLSGYMKQLPLSETVEKYTLEVYNSSDVLITTIVDIVSPTYTYVSATEVKFKVYQVSSKVGMGYPSKYITVSGV